MSNDNLGGKRDTDHDNSELLVSLDISTIGRVCELDGRHVVDTRNITHRRRVARAGFDLLAVCEGLPDAEADKIVATRKLAAKCEGTRSKLTC